eukprot:scaffold8496_cov66-Cyclotella_meneghiniana.AAC.14
MEDNEDFEPDESGNLDLKYRGWKELPNLEPFAYCIANLDVSFNQLQTLPDGISSLKFLQVLNCSCNQLQSLPDGIGCLESITILKANGNQLTTIPSTIGQCKNLQELILSENIITSLPQELDGCTSLQRLLIQNNDLSRLPLSLASLNGILTELDVSNNNAQLVTTIPIEVHRDIDSIMWILALQREKRVMIDSLKLDTKNLQHDIVGYEYYTSQLQEQIKMLKQKKHNIESEMEEVKYFLIAREYQRLIKSWMETKWEQITRAWSNQL